MDPWNGIESPEINLSLYGQLVFHKQGRSIKGANRGKIASSENDVGKFGQLHAKK